MTGTIRKSELFSLKQIFILRARELQQIRFPRCQRLATIYTSVIIATRLWPSMGEFANIPKTKYPFPLTKYSKTWMITINIFSLTYMASRCVTMNYEVIITHVLPFSDVCWPISWMFSSEQRRVRLEKIKCSVILIK